MITKQSLLEALNLEKLSVTLTHIMSALKGPYIVVQTITDITEYNQVQDHNHLYVM